MYGRTYFHDPRYRKDKRGSGFFKWSTLFWHKIEDRLIVARAWKIERFLSQAFFVAEVFTGSPEKYVGLY